MNRLLFAITMALALVLPSAVFAGGCPRCKGEMDPQWKYCPYDGAVLVRNCPACGRELKPEWRFCPHDGTDLPLPGTTPSTPSKPKAPADAAAASTPKPGDFPPYKVLDPVSAIELFRRAVIEREREWLALLFDWETFLREEPGLAEMQGAERESKLGQARDRWLDWWLSPAFRKSVVESRLEVTSIRIDKDRAEIAAKIIPEEKEKPWREATFQLATDVNLRWRILGFQPSDAW